MLTDDYLANAGLTKVQIESIKGIADVSGNVAVFEGLKRKSTVMKDSDADLDVIKKIQDQKDKNRIDQLNVIKSGTLPRALDSDEYDADVPAGIDEQFKHAKYNSLRSRDQELDDNGELEDLDNKTVSDIEKANKPEVEKHNEEDEGTAAISFMVKFLHALFTSVNLSYGNILDDNLITPNNISAMCSRKAQLDPQAHELMVQTMNGLSKLNSANVSMPLAKLLAFACCANIPEEVSFVLQDKIPNSYSKLKYNDESYVTDLGLDVSTITVDNMFNLFNDAIGSSKKETTQSALNKSVSILGGNTVNTGNSRTYFKNKMKEALKKKIKKANSNSDLNAEHDDDTDYSDQLGSLTDEQQQDERQDSEDSEDLNFKSMMGSLGED